MISVQGVVHTLVLLICAGLIFGLLAWLLDYVKPPEPFYKVGKIVLAVAGVLVLIGLLLSLAGYPVLVW